VYAYPWPDEEAVTAALFDRYAGPGAVLAFWGAETGFRLWRKGGKTRREGDKETRRQGDKETRRPKPRRSGSEGR
jgi:hypothetical protein